MAREEQIRGSQHPIDQRLGHLSTSEKGALRIKARHYVSVSCVQYLPVECFRTDRLELATLFGPSTPTGVLESDSVGNLVLLLGHGLPTAPHVFVSPLMTQIVDADGGHPGLDLCVIGGRSIVGDGWVGLGCGQHFGFYADLSRKFVIAQRCESVRESKLRDRKLLERAKGDCPVRCCRYTSDLELKAHEYCAALA